MGQLSLAFLINWDNSVLFLQHFSASFYAINQVMSDDISPAKNTCTKARAVGGTAVSKLQPSDLISACLLSGTQANSNNRLGLRLP